MESEIRKGIEDARRKNRVDFRCRKAHFSYMSPAEIRSTLKIYGLNPHMELWIESTEVAIISPPEGSTPMGILMQVRPADNDKLGLWGGPIKDNDHGAVYAAIRRVYEETGLLLQPAELKPEGLHAHNHKYANGDLAYFYANRFSVWLKQAPDPFTLDPSDTTDVILVTADNFCYHEGNIINHQLSFIKRLLEVQ